MNTAVDAEDSETPSQPFLPTKCESPTKLGRKVPLEEKQSSSSKNSIPHHGTSKRHNGLWIEALESTKLSTQRAARRKPRSVSARSMNLHFDPVGGAVEAKEHQWHLNRNYLREKLKNELQGERLGIVSKPPAPPHGGRRLIRHRTNSSQSTRASDGVGSTNSVPTRNASTTNRNSHGKLQSQSVSVSLDGSNFPPRLFSHLSSPRSTTSSHGGGVVSSSVKTESQSCLQEKSNSSDGWRGALLKRKNSTPGTLAEQVDDTLNRAQLYDEASAILRNLSSRCGTSHSNRVTITKDEIMALNRFVSLCVEPEYTALSERVERLPEEYGEDVKEYLMSEFDESIGASVVRVAGEDAPQHSHNLTVMTDSFMNDLVDGVVTPNDPQASSIHLDGEDRTSSESTTPLAKSLSSVSTDRGCLPVHGEQGGESRHAALSPSLRPCAIQRSLVVERAIANLKRAKSTLRVGSTPKVVIPRRTNSAPSYNVNHKDYSCSRNTEMLSREQAHNKELFVEPREHEIELDSQPQSNTRSNTPKHEGSDEPQAPSVEHPETALTSTLETMLRDLDKWDFDMFLAQDLSPNGALPFVGFALFERHGILDVFNMDETTLSTFLDVVKSKYPDNPYHNSIHAADVTQCLSHFLVHGGLESYAPTPLVRFAALFSALVHDINHPGVNNSFLIQTQHDLAVLYNDKSPLEMMHAATAFQLLQQQECDILHSLSAQEKLAFRPLVVSLVLSTDNAEHSSLMKQASKYTVDVTPGFRGKPPMSLAMEIGLHAADICASARPWNIYMRWSGRVITEFRQQGDLERSMGIKVIPLMDRHCPQPISRFQSGFVRAVVRPLYETMNRFRHIEISHCLKILDSNLETLEDIGKISESRSSISSSPPQKPSEVRSQEYYKTFNMFHDDTSTPTSRPVTSPLHASLASRGGKQHEQQHQFGDATPAGPPSVYEASQPSGQPRTNSLESLMEVGKVALISHQAGLAWSQNVDKQCSAVRSEHSGSPGAPGGKSTVRSRNASREGFD